MKQLTFTLADGKVLTTPPGLVFEWGSRSTPTRVAVSEVVAVEVIDDEEPKPE